ncbi:hypothetical protein [Streptomyces nanshensis]|uniref:Uncharacterized protein n=1 Tax=Streptomyces nanshensis TaxID=518642 RepID=A0A1E7LC68_9ACTN|nr:hypothetical protein [Streptomyces nanshensis]OEV13750.1 hypothetical protein AN218_02145 [Streptomyces nanshensis]
MSGTAEVIQLAGGDADVTAAVITAAAALLGAAGGAMYGARGVQKAARTQARGGYTTALEQHNHEARRAAFVDFYTLGLTLLKDLKDFAGLDSRTIGTEEPADPFVDQRERVNAAAAEIRILGPRQVWERAREFRNQVEGVTWGIRADHAVFYGWRNLGLARRAAPPLPETAVAARRALSRIYHARSDSTQEREHAAATAPLRDAEAAGLITGAQREALHADPMGVGEERRLPEEKLSPARAQLKEALEAFAEVASASLEDTTLPPAREEP